MFPGDCSPGGGRTYARAAPNASAPGPAPGRWVRLALPPSSLRDMAGEGRCAKKSHRVHGLWDDVLETSRRRTDVPVARQD